MTTPHTNLRKIEVALSTNPYPVLIGRGALDQLGEQICNQGFRGCTKVLIVTNSVVSEHYEAAALTSLRRVGFDASVLVIEAGEEQKTPATVGLIHDAAFTRKLERSSLIVALGGGVVGDMAGFAAATWLRGIAVVQVPSTLLAMVDAAIGGKTGVNHPGGKNLIGAFHQPKLVLIDPNLLTTLPEREFRAGMAEVIKYGIITDGALFNELENCAGKNPTGGLSSRDAVGNELLGRIIEYSAEAKANIVASDERESGTRAILNFGHTIGHVVETLHGYGRYLHGEAVALGMLAAGEISVSLKMWGRPDQERMKRLIQAASLPVNMPAMDFNAILDCLQADKKVLNGKLRFVLPTRIGSVCIRNDVNIDTIKEAVSSLTTKG